MSEQQAQMAVDVYGDVTSVTLAELAGFDVSGVEAFRGGPAPVGVWHWRVKEAALDNREFNDNETGGKVLRPYVQLTFEAVNCMSLADRTLNPAEFIGIEHREMIIIRDVKRDVGRVIAFCEDTNFQFRGELGMLVASLQGHEFIGPTKHRPDKNDKDRVYCNLVWDKLVPAEAAAPHVAAVQQAEAAMATPAPQPPPQPQPQPAPAQPNPLAGLPGVAATG